MFLNPDVVYVRISKVLFQSFGCKLHVTFLHRVDFCLKNDPNCSCRQWILS